MGGDENVDTQSQKSLLVNLYTDTQYKTKFHGKPKWILNDMLQGNCKLQY